MFRRLYLLFQFFHIRLQKTAKHQKPGKLILQFPGLLLGIIPLMLQGIRLLPGLLQFLLGLVLLLPGLLLPGLVLFLLGRPLILFRPDSGRGPYFHGHKEN